MQIHSRSGMVCLRPGNRTSGIGSVSRLMFALMYLVLTVKGKTLSRDASGSFSGADLASVSASASTSASTSSSSGPDSQSGCGFDFCPVKPCSKNPCSRVFGLPSSFRIVIAVLPGLVRCERCAFLVENQFIGTEIDHDVKPVVGGPRCAFGAATGGRPQLSRGCAPMTRRCVLVVEDAPEDCGRCSK